MYDEISNDLNEQFKDFPRKKTPLWGKAIKTILEQKKSKGEDISIQSLANKAGMNDKNLFNIVAGRVQDPSSDKLVRIAEALGLSFPELAERAIGAWEGSVFVCGFSQRGYIDYSQHGFAIQSLTPPGATNRDFFVGLMMIKPFKEMKKWKFDKNATIFMFVENGTLEITIGNQIKTVNANESIYFDGGISHKIKNVDSIETKIFLVTRPPMH